MKGFKLRVTEERDILHLKIIKLRDFIMSSTFMELSVDDRTLFVDQLDAMERYENILNCRINRFN